MTSKKEKARSGLPKTNGKKTARPGRSKKEKPSKYTIMIGSHFKQQIKTVTGIWQDWDTDFHRYNDYNTIASVIRDLPKSYISAVKMYEDLKLQYAELQSKYEQLEILEAAFCRILKHCGGKIENATK